MKNGSRNKKRKKMADWVAPEFPNANKNFIGSEIIIKNFFDVINNRPPEESTGKIHSLVKMIQSVTELEKDGILDKSESKVLVEFVVQKFIESKFDKILEELQVDNDYNWFVAASKYSKK
jgi:hypothetical protein